MKLNKPVALRLFEIVQLYGADDAARHLGVTLQIIQRGVCGLGLQPASYLALVEGIPGLDGGPPADGREYRLRSDLKAWELDDDTSVAPAD